MQTENSRNVYKINVNPDMIGTILFTFPAAPMNTGPLVRVILLPLSQDAQFFKTIEVTVNPPKKRVYHQTVETQQTIRTQDVFPDFPGDPIVSETEPESSEDERAAGSSCIQKVNPMLVVCMRGSLTVHLPTVKADH
jgi:hypothetical protein